MIHNIKIGKIKIGEIDDSNSDIFNKILNNIDYSIKSAYLDDFLNHYLFSKKLTGKELEFAINNILKSYKNSNNNFNTGKLIKNIKTKKISIQYLIESDNFINLLSNEYESPVDFLENVFCINGKPGSASVGSGEYLLLLFTNLVSAESKDLIDLSDNLIYEVKDNGNNNGGFRVGSQGKSASMMISVLNNSSHLYNYSTKLPLNSTKKGKGIFIGEILNIANKNLNEINIKTFIQSFLTFEDSYSDDIKESFIGIINNNDINEYRSLIACLQLWGYMKAEKIDRVIVYERSKGKPYNIGLIIFYNNFNNFFNKYKKELQIITWENDGRNMSFRIRWKKNTNNEKH